MSAVVAQQHVLGHRNVAGFKHINGFHASDKVSRPQWYRSSYELRYMELLDADPEVIAYQVEPVRIPYLFEGSVRNYVPDFLVTRADGVQWLIEVKPAALVGTDQNLAKARAARLWCEASGAQLVLVTEETLNTLTRMAY